MNGVFVLDADAHSDAQSDAQSDADERSHIPKFPRTDKIDNVPQSVCQATIFIWNLQKIIQEVGPILCFLLQI